MVCPHMMRPGDLPIQRNALRIEIMLPQPRCALRPKKDQFGRRYNVVRYVLSGGDAIDAACRCVGQGAPGCPLNVFAESSIMSDSKSGPCPVCRTLNRREGFGPVTCRECGLVFNLCEEGGYV